MKKQSSSLIDTTSRPAGRLSRRRLLGNVARAALTGAVALGAPAIIGRAIPANAKTSFAGEGMIIATWSGNHDRLFREMVMAPFNERYDAKLDTIGVWDQSVAQIVAAPADNPPYDVAIAEEFLSSSGLSEQIYLRTEPDKVPNLKHVNPWFYDLRAEHAKPYGIPFTGGNVAILANTEIGFEPSSWRDFWRPELERKTTLDSAGWWFTIAIPAILSGAQPGVQEIYDPAQTEPLFQELERLKPAKWYKDGAEQTYLMLQEEALMAMVYTTDAYALLQEAEGRFTLSVPQEGTPGWTDWFFKVRGTRHSDLADAFLNYLLELDTQNRFLSRSLQFMARSDVTVPAHWKNYPRTRADFERMIHLLTIEGWDNLLANWETLDKRFKEVVTKTA